MSEVIIAEHVCLDIVPRSDRDAGVDLSSYMSPGRLSEVGPVALSTGGAVSNTGLNLKRLGVDTLLMGKTSDDFFGRAIMDIVRSYGPELTEEMIVVPGRQLHLLRWPGLTIPGVNLFPYHTGGRGSCVLNYA